jgi:hypothetical protein
MYFRIVTDLLVGIADVDTNHGRAERGQGRRQAIILPADGLLLTSCESGRCHRGGDL